MRQSTGGDPPRDGSALRDPDGTVTSDGRSIDGPGTDVRAADAATDRGRDHGHDRGLSDLAPVGDSAADLPSDLSTDSAPTDLPPAADGPALCPAGMVAVDRSVDGGSAVFCIDQDQGTALIWIDAEQHCASLDKRLCLEAEWVAACLAAAGGLPINEMVGDWEWVAEVDGDCGRKRGYTACESASCHSIDSGGYPTRCCR